jgi:hypothetical protein
MQYIDSRVAAEANHPAVDNQASAIKVCYSR